MLLDFKQLDQARTKTRSSEQQREAQYHAVLEAGRTQLKAFHQEPQKHLLTQAVEQFLKATGCKSNGAEAYFHLAYCMYLLNQDRYALQYFKLAQHLRPDLAGLDKLRGLLSTQTCA